MVGRTISNQIALLALAATLAAAQAPRVGDVEYYGFRKVGQENARRALNLSPGDALPPSKGDLEELLEGISGIVQARVEAVCCEDGKAVLFVGVEERGATRFDFRLPPAGAAELPREILETHAGFMAAVASAARRGSTGEDLTRGHSLMADPDARDLQLRFSGYAESHAGKLRAVLRDAADPAQRAVAAAVLGYSPNKKSVLADLQYAMQDPDEAVRANAMRALGAIAVLAAREPAQGIRIQSTWFVEMLNSLSLSDRTRAAAALVTLTEYDAAALGQVRDRALDSVVEMARWKTLRYALPAFILAGRMAGMGQNEIEAAWTSGQRESVIGRLGKRR
jgi:hypothetical protein